MDAETNVTFIRQALMLNLNSLLWSDFFWLFIWSLNVKFQCELVTVVKKIIKTSDTTRGCTTVNMEATEVNINSFNYRLMCNKSQQNAEQMMMRMMRKRAKVLPFVEQRLLFLHRGMCGCGARSGGLWGECVDRNSFHTRFQDLSGPLLTRAATLNY